MRGPSDSRTGSNNPRASANLHVGRHHYDDPLKSVSMPSRRSFLEILHALPGPEVTSRDVKVLLHQFVSDCRTFRKEPTKLELDGLKLLAALTMHEEEGGGGAEEELNRILTEARASRGLPAPRPPDIDVEAEVVEDGSGEAEAAALTVRPSPL